MIGHFPALPTSGATQNTQRQNAWGTTGTTQKAQPTGTSQVPKNPWGNRVAGTVTSTSPKMALFFLTWLLHFWTRRRTEAEQPKPEQPAEVKDTYKVPLFLLLLLPEEKRWGWFRKLFQARLNRFLFPVGRCTDCTHKKWEEEDRSIRCSICENAVELKKRIYDPCMENKLKELYESWTKSSTSLAELKRWDEKNFIEQLFEYVAKGHYFSWSRLHDANER